MIYDLTALFTTVAAASASIVAILGGFIASKLISISGERKSVLGKIDEVNEQLRAKQMERDRLQEKAYEDVAIAFIRTNVNALLDDKLFEDVIGLSFSDGIPEEKLKEYWEKARAISREILDYCKPFGNSKCTIEVNQHNIPIDIVGKYHKDYFAYSVCREVGDRYINKIMYFDAADQVLQKNFSPGRGSVIQALLDVKQFSDIETDIKWLCYKKKELEEEKSRLDHPKGMRAGVVIFALFSFFCIVFPLLLSPFSTDDYCMAMMLKIVILALFFIGLVCIVFFFGKLLRWKEGSK